MIAPGSDYGVPAEPPSSAIVVDSDAAGSMVLAEARRLGERLPALVLRGGDLHRTLGGVPRPVDRRTDSHQMIRFPVDLGVVEVDGTEHLFLAHAVLRLPLWRGRFIVLMNAQWCGPLDLGPRSHPGDGLLDVTDGSLTLRQRLEARRRARSGTHLPHPDLRTRRTTQLFIEESDRPLMLHLDGVRVLRCRTATVTLESDAVTVYV